jgi:hypothetical protein
VKEKSRRRRLGSIGALRGPNIKTPSAAHNSRKKGYHNLQSAGTAEGLITKIGGRCARSGFERYAIVSQTDIADPLKKLEAS